MGLPLPGAAASAHNHRLVAAVAADIAARAEAQSRRHVEFRGRTVLLAARAPPSSSSWLFIRSFNCLVHDGVGGAPPGAPAQASLLLHSLSNQQQQRRGSSPAPAAAAPTAHQGAPTDRFGWAAIFVAIGDPGQLSNIRFARAPERRIHGPGPASSLSSPARAPTIAPAHRRPPQPPLNSIGITHGARRPPRVHNCTHHPRCRLITSPRPSHQLFSCPPMASFLRDASLYLRGCLLCLSIFSSSYGFALCLVCLHWC